MGLKPIQWAFDSGKNLSPSERFILVALAEHSNGGEPVWPSIPTLASKTSYSKRTVRRALSALEEKGFISRKLRHKKTTIYHLVGASKWSSDTGGVTQCQGVTQSHLSEDTLSISEDTLSNLGGHSVQLGGHSVQFGLTQCPPEPSIEPSIEPSTEPSKEPSPPFPPPVGGPSAPLRESLNGRALDREVLNGDKAASRLEDILEGIDLPGVNGFSREAGPSKASRAKRALEGWNRCADRAREIEEVDMPKVQKSTKTAKAWLMKIDGYLEGDWSRLESCLAESWNRGGPTAADFSLRRLQAYDCNRLQQILDGFWKRPEGEIGESRKQAKIEQMKARYQELYDCTNSTVTDNEMRSLRIQIEKLGGSVR